MSDLRRSIPLRSTLSAGALAGASLGASGLAFLWQLIAARQLDIEAFASISLGLSTVHILAGLVVLGTNQLLLRAVAEGDLDPGTVLVVRQLNSIGFTVASIIAFALLWLSSVEERSLMILFVATALLAASSADLLRSVYDGAHEHGRSGVVALALPIVRTICVVLLPLSILTTFGSFATALSISNLVIFVPCAVLLRRCIRSFTVSGSVARVRQRTDSLLFAADGVMFVAFYRLDIFMVDWVVGIREAGKYSLAVTLVSVGHLLSHTTLVRFYLPRLYARERQGQEQSSLPIVPALAIAGVGALLIGAGALFLAEPLFGADFADSAELGALLSIGIPIRTISSLYGVSLLAQGRLATKVRVLGGAVAFNAGATLLALYAFGTVGAVVATLASELTLLWCYRNRVREKSKQ